MSNINQEDGSKLKPPWSYNRVGKYSLEEIALEFILWEDEDAHSDALRQEFVTEALEQSFGQENRDRMLSRFLDTYRRLYDKIYQRDQGNIRKEDRATPDTMRGIFERMMMKSAA